MIWYIIAAVTLLFAIEGVIIYIFLNSEKNKKFKQFLIAEINDVLAQPPLKPADAKTIDDTQETSIETIEPKETNDNEININDIPEIKAFNLDKNNQNFTYVISDNSTETDKNNGIKSILITAELKSNQLENDKINTFDIDISSLTDDFDKIRLYPTIDINNCYKVACSIKIHNNNKNKKYQIMDSYCNNLDLIVKNGIQNNNCKSFFINPSMANIDINNDKTLQLLSKSSSSMFRIRPIKQSGEMSNRIVLNTNIKKNDSPTMNLSDIVKDKKFKESQYYIFNEYCYR